MKPHSPGKSTLILRMVPGQDLNEQQESYEYHSEALQDYLSGIYLIDGIFFFLAKN